MPMIDPRLHRGNNSARQNTNSTMALVANAQRGKRNIATNTDNDQMDKDNDDEKKIESKGSSDRPSRPNSPGRAGWKGVGTENWIFPVFKSETTTTAVSSRTRDTPEFKTFDVLTIFVCFD
ncbi:hypothetical protein niasHT_036712 [Heterodera trifolii]|uniref:Uncharacterized protein n=1 Tax=Heterodera trifolii TaxID=157864 RepID=A0ABD2IRR8_9BILA